MRRIVLDMPDFVAETLDHLVSVAQEDMADKYPDDYMHRYSPQNYIYGLICLSGMEYLKTRGEGND